MRFGTVDTGTYWGDGGSGQTVSGLNFIPEALIVVPLNTAPVQFRTAGMPTDYGTSFAADGLYLDHIEDFGPGQFRVGGDPAVNAAGQGRAGAPHASRSRSGRAR